MNQYLSTKKFKTMTKEWISLDEYEKIALEKLANKPVIKMLLADKKCGSFKDWPPNIQRLIDEEMNATREIRIKINH